MAHRDGVGACAALAVLLAVIACGGTQKPPARGVIESDVGGWAFRRYQILLDIEVWVPKNRAKAHTASYARKSAEKTGRLSEEDVANAFVTRYRQHEGVSAALARFVRRLARESGYDVEEAEVEGVRLIKVTGRGEAWAFWVADRHVVKLGGRGRQSVPEDLIEAYGERYPSRMKSGFLDAPLEPEPKTEEPDRTPFDPNNPEPDWHK